ncbi:MAG: hypothetical protein N2045_14085, partial [Fimbriimonadales bacterium]|nr:hypothetical protein [Fimbriimonadales bacterium]
MNEQAIAAAQGRLDRALALAEQAFRDMAAYGAPDQGAEVAYLRALRRAERAAEELDCLTRAVGQGEPGRAALE